MIKVKHILIVITLLLMIAMMTACQQAEAIPNYPETQRVDRIPSECVKYTPENDLYPPILYSEDFEAPVPLPGEINTCGGEDSPFILPDGKTLYFFFTPDVGIAPEEQLSDEVTGGWVSYKENGIWSEAQRVWIQDPGLLALDGAVCVSDDEMWFASAREGYFGVNIFIAEMVDGAWTNWEYSGDRLMKEIGMGELHKRGDEIYFHSDREGGSGQYDLWMTTKEGNSWSDPVNLKALNTSAMDGFPFVSSDGNELWFTRTYLGTPAIFRSVKQGGAWQEAEMIVSQFAGEPTLDDEGNLYFVHHNFENDKMLEADKYFAKRK
jgi:hypothetical protein